MGEMQRISAPRPVQRQTVQPDTRESSAIERARLNRTENDGSSLRLMMSSGALQPRLTVGAADDVYEREAERTADAVISPGSPMKAGDIGIHRSGIAAGLTRVVRRAIGKLDPPAKKDDDKKPDDDGKKKLVQKRSAGPAPSLVPASVESGIETMTAGGGSSLPIALRAKLEPRFGYDFSAVRVHTDVKAENAATALGARAFTVGDHVFFGDGQYQPTSTQGQRLIAHELAHVVQQGSDPNLIRRRTIDSWTLGGTTFFRTRSGEIIELPEDKTAEEVAKIEDEAMAAENKLKELPPPKPVPEVRKAAPKPAKTVAPKPRPHSRKRAAKPVPKVADVAAALLKSVGGGPVAKYLVTKAAPVFANGAAKLAHLRTNQQTHQDGGEKLAKSEDAVKIPESEEQSTGNQGQVAVVGDRIPPVVDENKGKGKLQESLNENVPHSIGELDNFKRDKKAQHTGAEVLDVVQGAKNATIGTFGDVRLTPPPVPSNHIPAELPPPEPAPPTAVMNLGRGSIAPLQKEHTDVSDYGKQADAKLKEEGVTQEQLDMVDSGDLAEANKERKGMARMAATEPLAVQKMAQEERTRVDKDLTQEEHTERASLASRRKSALSATGVKQDHTRTALEKKRDAVANEINGRYKTTQDKVTKRLADLDQESMTRFDKGNVAAAKDFEADVNRELDAYKHKRYSGWFGWARKAKDWLLGIDKLPRVKEIFDNNRAAFEKRINKLVEDISADNARVIQECKDELAATRAEIGEYVARLEPGLKEIGKKAAGEMQEKLDNLDKEIGKKEEDLKNKLKDKQTAAIRAIDEKIEKMKESMSGALAKIGRFLLWAAKKFFTWALEKFGVSLSTIESIINKGTAVLKAIFTGPIQFVKNLIAAAKLGFTNFAKHFVTHLKDALFEWLTGSLEGVTLPDSWTVRGIVSVLFQVVGITWTHLKERILLLVPAPVVENLQKTFGLVKTLVSEGPMAAWEQIKEMGEELKKSFVSSLTDWIKIKVVEEAVKTVLALFVPGAGIIRAVIAIYDTIVFFIQKAKDIMEMIGNFLGSIAEIAAGNIASAADALENGLARGLKLVIMFLAKFLRLDGITARIRAVLDTVRGKVTAVLDKIAAWVVKQAKGLIGTVKTAAGKLLDWWRAKKPFHTADGEDHQIGFVGEESSAELAVYSSPQTMSVFVRAWSKGIDAMPDTAKKSQQERALVTAKAKFAIVTALQNELGARIVKGADESLRQSKVDKLTAELAALATALALRDVGQKTVFPPPIFPPFVNRVRASSFKASYLTKPVIGSGSETDGSTQPKSWDIVRANKLSENARWVQMHLLTAVLGGQAVESNLVPARGPETNIRFRDRVEHPARNALSIAGAGAEPMIWYDVKLQFHSTSDTYGSGFPSYLGVSWGGYEEKNGAWKEKPASAARSFEQNLSLPTFDAKSGQLKINLEGRQRLASVFGISDLYSRRLVEMRDRQGAFANAKDLTDRVRAYNASLATAIESKAKDTKLVSYSVDP